MPNPQPGGPGFSVLLGLPSLSHYIPLFIRGTRKSPILCCCCPAAVGLHYQGYDEDIRQLTWQHSLRYGGHCAAFMKHIWWPQYTPMGPT